MQTPRPYFVIPAKAGTHFSIGSKGPMDPGVGLTASCASAGMTQYANGPPKRAERLRHLRRPSFAMSAL